VESTSLPEVRLRHLEIVRVPIPEIPFGVRPSGQARTHHCLHTPQCQCIANRCQYEYVVIDQRQIQHPWVTVVMSLLDCQKCYCGRRDPARPTRPLRPSQSSGHGLYVLLNTRAFRLQHRPHCTYCGGGAPAKFQNTLHVSGG
jgi:hypothetical protein